MQITVTFESLEEFQKYFGPAAPAAAAPVKQKARPKTETPAPAETPAPVEAPAEEAKQEAPKPETPAEEAKQEAPKPEAPAPAPQEKITKTDVRAVALKLSKAGKSKELKAIFSEFGAEKLSDIKEEDYPALMAKLGAVDA